MQGLGYVERLDRSGRAVDGSLLHERATIEQHPHRLDGVEGHAL
jgi:hypothetical protein